MRLLTPNGVAVRPVPGKRCVRVTSGWNRWPAHFPQQGPGRKHERRIELSTWQQEMAQAHLEALIRGLIRSDGCRTVNRFKTKLPSGRTAEYELRALLLLEPVGGHPCDLLSGLRAARDRVDAVQPPQTSACRTATASPGWS
jgi:hypothetical protein